MSIIEAEAVSRSFGDVQALLDFDLTVDDGEIVGIIGPSGGGKTTALRLLAGLDHPTSGSVRVFDRDPRLLSAQQRARLGLLSQDPAIVEEFTIGEQVRFAARLRGQRGDVGAMIELVGLADSVDTVLSRASGGMRRRAGLAATLVSDPDLVFCDEPTAGLDPIIRLGLWRWFRKRRQQGRAMIVTTQHIDEASRCDRVIVLRDGRVVFDDVPSAMARAAGLDERVVLEVERSNRDRARRVLEGHSWLVVPEADGLLAVSTTDGAATAAQVVRHLEEAGIAVDAVDTETPGLDDVFRQLIEGPQ